MLYIYIYIEERGGENFHKIFLMAQFQINSYLSGSLNTHFMIIMDDNELRAQWMKNQCILDEM